MSGSIDQWRNASPLSTQDDLPYNFTSTPILGSGSSPNVSSAEFQAIITSVQAIDPSATQANVQEAWQEFFYVFHPFVTDEIYDSDPETLENPDVTFDTGAYYNDIFLTKYEDWKNWQGGTGAGLPDNSFNYYLNNVDDSQLRQKNVIFWQFFRILDAISLLDTRTVNAASRRIMWAEAQKAAIELMASYSIPAIRPSDDDVRVPDPDSIQRQHNTMMNIERARRKQKTSGEKERVDDSNFSFASDNKSMHMSSLKSFWQTMSKVLGSVINI